MFLIRPPLRQQPQFAAPLDRSDPLARGLVFHVNLGVGNRDAVGQAGTVTDVGTVGRGASTGRFGGADGISGVNAGRSITVPNDSLRILSGPVTHAGLVRLTGIDSNFGAVFSVSDGSSFPAFTLQRDGTSNNLTLFRGDNGGQIITGSPVSALADGLQHLFIAVSEGVGVGTNGTLWIDGIKFTGTQSQATGNQAGAGVSVRFFLERSSNTAFGADGDYYQHWAWNRILSDAEALAFTSRVQRLSQAPARRLWAALSTGAFTATITEAASAADSSSQTATKTSAITEAATAADSSTVTATKAQAITEAASAADSSTALRGLFAGITEAATAADSSTGTGAFTAASTEAATAADSSTATGAFTAASTEAASAADSSSATLSGNYTASITEAATAADSSTVTGAFTAAVTEAASAADSSSASAAGNFTATITEAGTAADVSTAAMAATAAVTEPATAADAATAAGAFTAAITETATAADSSTGLPSGAYAAGITEAATAADASSSTATKVSTITEAAAAADSSTALRATFAQVLETANPIDVSAASWSAGAPPVTPARRQASTNLAGDARPANLAGPRRPSNLSGGRRPANRG